MGIDRHLWLALALFLLCSCDRADPVRLLAFSELKKIDITGYSGHAMEPFLSPDGQVLFFNNLNAAPENTNIHWATRVDDFTFEYNGEVGGVNTLHLEGVPTLDESGVLYFVSMRSYDQTLATVYQGTFSNGTVTGVSLLSNVSKNTPGWLNFDVEVDVSGTYLYVADGRFDSNGGPYEADLVIAMKHGSSFERMNTAYFANVNTSDLEYAACISRDQLELFFTRVATPLTSTSEPQIYGTTRSRSDGSFDAPVRITAATGFVEAPTLSPDGNRLYFHKLENGKFVIYTLIRTGL